MVKKSPLKFFVLCLALILLDQAVKLWMHFYVQPNIIGLIGNWLKLQYVLNPGMAFGMQLGHEYGKLMLSMFRLLAMGGITWYLVHLARRGAPDGLLWAMAMILAGAVGNVIDSTFYGILLNNAPYDAPTPWFHGQVIDMIYFDLWEGILPDWMPVFGGSYFSMPIFNIADSCIFIGVCIILFFQSNFFHEEHEDEGLLQDEPDANEASVLPASEIETEFPAEQPSHPDTPETGQNPEVENNPRI